MSKTICAFLMTIAFVTASHQATAALSPLSAAVMPPVQFPPSDFSITGARLSLIYGRHRDVYGLDVGVLGNVTDQSFAGIGIAGLTNITRGTTTVLGLQAAGVTNINTGKTKVYGLQAALAVNYNSAESAVTGLQLSLFNISGHTKVNGVQAGLYNKANRVNGLQIGLVNITESLRGLQIGLVNFNHTGTFVVSPILNIGF